MKESDHFFVSTNLQSFFTTFASLDYVAKITIIVISHHNRINNKPLSDPYEESKTRKLPEYLVGFQVLPVTHDQLHLPKTTTTLQKYEGRQKKIIHKISTNFKKYNILVTG